jgi:threonyl-tRNA synthetase
VGGLIEHYGGRFPLWLAPEQVAIVPIREEHGDYARDLAARLRRELFRVRCLDEPTHMNKRIKTAKQERVPLLLIVGAREADEGTCAVQPRGDRGQRVMPFDELVALARDLRERRALELPDFRETGG